MELEKIAVYSWKLIFLSLTCGSDCLPSLFLLHYNASWKTVLQLNSSDKCGRMKRCGIGFRKEHWYWWVHFLFRHYENKPTFCIKITPSSWNCIVACSLHDFGKQSLHLLSRWGCFSFILIMLLRMTCGFQQVKLPNECPIWHRLLCQCNWTLGDFAVVYYCTGNHL